MRIQQLHYIIKIVETGSMNEAAKQLFITQPSLSNAVRDLEREMGIDIFIRNPKGITLTKDGVEFLSYARQVVEQTNLLEERYKSHTETRELFSVSSQHYAFVVNAFVSLLKRADMTRYELFLRETRTYEIIEDVKNFRSEIGVLFLNSYNRDVLTKMFDDNRLTYTSLFKARPHIFVSKSNPLAKHEVVSLEDLKKALRKDTILVSMMMVNNEIGALEPIEEAGKIIKDHNPATVFHVDAIQAYGKFQIIPKRMHIDLLSVSGHKIHGPKGIGFLYIKDKTKIRPISFGGDQQKGMRSGTINVPGIAGLGVAATEAYDHLEDNAEHLYELKAYFTEKLQQLEDVTINGKTDRDSAPQIVSASFVGVRSEVLLHSLEDRNIYVSAGSACSSNHPSLSSTLLNIGLDHAHQESTLRFSFCPETTKEELDYTYSVLEELLPMLRRYRRH